MMRNFPTSTSRPTDALIEPVNAETQATRQDPSRLSSTESKPPVLLTLEQAAALLHFAPSTLRRFALAGRLPATKVGKCWRFHRDLLCDWLKAQSLENVKPCPSVVAKAPRIGKFGFSSLDARLEA